MVYFYFILFLFYLYTGIQLELRIFYSGPRLDSIVYMWFAS